MLACGRYESQSKSMESDGIYFSHTDRNFQYSDGEFNTWVRSDRPVRIILDARTAHDSVSTRGVESSYRTFIEGVVGSRPNVEAITNQNTLVGMIVLVETRDRLRG